MIKIISNDCWQKNTLLVSHKLLIIEDVMWVAIIFQYWRLNKITPNFTNEFYKILTFLLQAQTIFENVFYF